MKIVQLFVFLFVLFVAVHAQSDAYCFDGSEIAECFADPCLSANCTNGCVADYCGGCNARCTCESDNECGLASFCAESSEIEGFSNDRLCHAYSQEGESCGGFVAVETRCDLGLTCVYNPNIMDIPGRCRKECSAQKMEKRSVKNRQCDASTFCGDDACLPHGTCISTKDCARPDNEWMHAMCVGTPSCSLDGDCVWDCDDGYQI